MWTGTNTCTSSVIFLLHRRSANWRQLDPQQKRRRKKQKINTRTALLSFSIASSYVCPVCVCVRVLFLQWMCALLLFHLQIAKVFQTENVSSAFNPSIDWQKCVHFVCVFANIASEWHKCDSACVCVCAQGRVCADSWQSLVPYWRIDWFASCFIFVAAVCSQCDEQNKKKEYQVCVFRPSN